LLRLDGLGGTGGLAARPGRVSRDDGARHRFLLFGLLGGNLVSGGPLTRLVTAAGLLAGSGLLRGGDLGLGTAVQRGRHVLPGPLHADPAAGGELGYRMVPGRALKKEQWWGRHHGNGRGGRTR
jgi:hypothetical protein